MTARRARVYGHGYCHLCEEMLRALAPWQRSGALDVEFIDIEGDADLEEQFGERVPVLMVEEHEICHYFLQEQRLADCLGYRV